MRKKYEEKILKYLMTNMSFSDRILLILFKKYSYTILRKGIEIGYCWEDDESQPIVMKCQRFVNRDKVKHNKIE